MRVLGNEEKLHSIYDAVATLLGEGQELSSLKVSDIMKCAGMGKATAYDYFQSKEELIINALLYFAETTVKRLQRHLEQLDSFEEKFMCLCTQIEKKNQERTCLMKYITYLNESGKWEQIKRDYLPDCNDLKDLNPYIMIYHLVDEGKSENIIKADVPQVYAGFTIATKLFAYMVYVDQKEHIAGFDSEQMKKYIYEGIVKEFA